MTATASDRRFHSRACSPRMIGQVAMTSVAAQMIAGRKGLTIHSEMPISRAMNRIASVRRVRSKRVSCIAVSPGAGAGPLERSARLAQMTALRCVCPPPDEGNPVARPALLPPIWPLPSLPPADGQLAAATGRDKKGWGGTKR